METNIRRTVKKNLYGEWKTMNYFTRIANQC